MLRERWDEIVPADNDADEESSRTRLAWASEGFDAERWRFNLLICRYTLVLSSVEEVLALVGDECPLCERTASVAAGGRGLACGLDAADCISVYALLLKQDLRRQW